MTDGGQPVPEQIAAAIEASDYPELTIREVMERTDLSKGQVTGAAGRMHRLQLDTSLGVVRLGDDDGGEFVDDHEDELLPDGGHCEPDTERERWPVGEYHSCFECGDEVHQDNAEYDEKSPGSYFVLCPDCSVDAGTNRSEGGDRQ